MHTKTIFTLFHDMFLLRFHLGIKYKFCEPFLVLRSAYSSAKFGNRYLLGNINYMRTVGKHQLKNSLETSIRITVGGNINYNNYQDTLIKGIKKRLKSVFYQKKRNCPTCQPKINCRKYREVFYSHFQGWVLKQKRRSLHSPSSTEQQAVEGREGGGESITDATPLTHRYQLLKQAKSYHYSTNYSKCNFRDNIAKVSYMF